MNMEKTELSKYTVSFGLSLALTSVVNGLLVVAKEKVPAVLTGMKRLTGHHWVSHAAIIVGLFLLGGWLFAQANGGQGIRLTANRFLGTLVAGVVMGALIILGFYLVGD